MTTEPVAFPAEPHICVVTEFEDDPWRASSDSDLVLPFRVTCTVCAFAVVHASEDGAYLAADHHYDVEVRRASSRVRELVA